MRSDSDSSTRWSNALLWIASLFVVLLAAFVTVVFAWAAWSSLGQAASMYEGASGGYRAYLIAGALVLAYLLLRLTPRAVTRLRRASTTYPDRVSKAYAVLRIAAPMLWASGFFALPIVLLWPVAIVSYHYFASREARKRETADRRQLDQFIAEAASPERDT